VSDELTKLSVTRLAELMRSREVSPVEVVEAHLRRVERLNPRLNAVVALAPDALERAREAAALVESGARGKPLLGVPVTVKDTIAVAGLPATSGSKARAGYVPGWDAPAISFLKEAGAIVIGKTNTSELALDYTTDNPVFGHTNNPHDLTRTPGGSSGGCAAAVGACLTAASVGSDLAGSIRIPAHFCGVAGLKPTAGRIVGVGHFPVMSSPYDRAASLGPLARTVEDLGLLFDVLTGDAFELGGEQLEKRRSEARAGLKGLRVAWYADDGHVTVTPETREAVKNAAEALRSAGLIVEESRPPGVERATELWLSLFSRATQEMVASVYEGREDDVGPTARALLKRASESAAPQREDELKAWAERDRLRAELLRWMSRTPILVAPVGAAPAFRHDETRRIEVCGQTFPTFRAFGHAQAFNVFDLPAACVPAGRTRAGLPVGVQIVGRPNEEETVLAAARVVEEALGGWQPPPEIPPSGALP
jgi:amidase